MLPATMWSTVTCGRGRTDPMFWTQTFLVPAPFHRVEFFSITEPVAESEGEITFAHRLYMVSPFAEGGRVLLRQMPAYALQKSLPAPAGEEGG